MAHCQTETPPEVVIPRSCRATAEGGSWVAEPNGWPQGMSEPGPLTCRQPATRRPDAAATRPRHGPPPVPFDLGGGRPVGAAVTPGTASRRPGRGGPGLPDARSVVRRTERAASQPVRRRRPERRSTVARASRNGIGGMAGAVETRETSSSLVHDEDRPWRRQNASSRR